MKNVLLLTRAMIPSAVLCGGAPLSALSSAGRIGLRCLAPSRVRAEDLDWADAVVFVRSDSPWEAALAELARGAGKGTAYVLDDDLLNVPRTLSSGEFYDLPGTKKAIRAVMDRCDLLLTPSEVLLEKYGGRFGLARLITEPALLPAAEPKRNEGGPVVVGFAGSIDRARDIDVILDTALRRVLARFGDGVRLEFFGAKPALAEEGLALHRPYLEDYEEYRSAMGTLGWDIALAPMPDTPFHRCKHFNKYVEYAAFGLPGIYSDVAVYRRAVRCGENGLLAANTPEAWFEAVCRLIEDAPLRRSIGACARREAETTYSLERAAEDWAGALSSLPERGKSPVPPGRFRVRHAAEELRGTGEKLRAYGWRAPARAVKKLSRMLKGKRS